MLAQINLRLDLIIFNRMCGCACVYMCVRACVFVRVCFRSGSMFYSKKNELFLTVCPNFESPFDEPYFFAKQTQLNSNETLSQAYKLDSGSFQ